MLLLVTLRKKFSIKDFLSKCDQIAVSLMEKFIFCAMWETWFSKIVNEGVHEILILITWKLSFISFPYLM